MTKFAPLAALVATATLVATPAFAAPVGATPKAQATARIIKPLTLVKNRDLDFGTIVVVGSDTVSVDQAGTRTCGAPANVTCSGAAQSAEYLVTGSNNQLVNVRKANSLLSNGAATLTFVPDAPLTVTLPNSGAAGVTFNVGGSIALLSSTPDGLYTGDIDVTVEY